MSDEGLSCLYNSKYLGLHFLTMRLNELFIAKKLLNAIFDDIVKTKPKIVLLIGFHEFTIRLAKKIRKKRFRQYHPKRLRNKSSQTLLLHISKTYSDRNISRLHKTRVY